MALLVISSWWDLGEKDGSSTYITNLISNLQSIFPERYFLFPLKKGFQWKNSKISFIHNFKFPGFVSNFSLGYFIDYNPFFHRTFSFIIKKYKISEVFIPFPWGIKYIKKNFPFLKIIYNAIGFEREFAKISWKNYPYFIKSLISHLIGLQEKFAINNSDITITVGDDLTKELILNFPKNADKIKTIKMGFNISQKYKNESKNESLYSKYSLTPEKKYLIFHGSRTHSPNNEAVLIIKKEIAPKLYKRNKNIEICIVGTGNSLYYKKNIHSFPFIVDLDQFISLMNGAIIPIISGSGIRIKAMDYLKHQLPLISTKKGVEGYSLSKKEVIITSNHIGNEFIDGIIKMIENEKETREMVKRCWDKISQELNNETLKILLKKYLIEKKIIPS
jgi:hypothetical protein